MKEYRYILEPYTGRNSRHTCPQCGKPHEFTRYIDTDTGEILADNVGRCNRIDQCGYHYTPKQYFADTGIKPENAYTKPVHVIKQLEPTFIPDEIFKQSLKGDEDNSLIKFFHSIFDTDTVNNLITRYKIGTSKRYGGGTTVFWQIDSQGKVRAGKLIKYAENGHRVHGKQNWVHSVLNIDNFTLKQCLFGEHLLKGNPDAIVAIVESEKTAIIASVFIPEMVWLATGGAENLNKEKVKVLRGRNVILFPDASKDGRIYNKWKQKADEFGFNISDLLEKEATPGQKADGVDIADFLIKQKWNEWDNVQSTTPPQEPEPVEVDPLPPPPPPPDWSNDISELETFFNQTELPTDPVKLNPWTTIIDTKLFIDSSLSFVKANNRNKYFRPYLNRLNEFRKLLTN
jgi:rubredoxin